MGQTDRKTTSTVPVDMNSKEGVFSVPSLLTVSTTQSPQPCHTTRDGSQVSLSGSHSYVPTTFLVVPKGPEPFSASVCKRLEL